MARVFISLGSNMGVPLANLKEALQMIDMIEMVRVVQVSSVFCTEPVGVEDQPWFYNCAAELRTEFSPTQLLTSLQAIENKMGRVRNIRWGPRIIDLDILLYDNYQQDSDQLTIPHPRMAERNFVMVPLAEIAAEELLPDGRAVREVVGKLKDIKKYICIPEKLW